MRRFLAIALASCSLMSVAGTSSAGTIWASTLGPLGLSRGDATIGNFPGFYGGTFPGAFPVALTPAEAEAAVLGPPDTSFLSLPGNEAADPTPSGAAFKWAFVDVAFGTNFSADADLEITELGDNGESVYVFVWTVDGGNVQEVLTRGASDTLVLDLAPYAGFVAAHGGAFTHVTLGGQDLLGASEGFDLDAVGIRVPEPATLALLGLALAGLGFARRRKAH